MMLGYGDNLKAPVRVLLDTACDTPLIKSTLIDRLNIRCYLHDIPRKIKNANGEIIQGAGKKYTPALRLRHQNHYDKLVFEVAPLEPAADVFLPCWWIDEHPVSGSFLTPELCFDSPNCLKNCTREAASKFPLVLDDSIISDPEARIIGYVSAIGLTETDPLELVPTMFRPFLNIMGKEAADSLPPHTSYDHEIILKEGEKPPWAPIYPLSEVELATL